MNLLLVIFVHNKSFVTSRLKKKNFLTSAKVVGSGAVGPEAMSQRGSFITSEMIRDTSGWFEKRIIFPRFPPLIALKCLRTVLNSVISAPLASNSVTTYKKTNMKAQEKSFRHQQQLEVL